MLRPLYIICQGFSIVTPTYTNDDIGLVFRPITALIPV